jgi:hypothetical protein
MTGQRTSRRSAPSRNSVHNVGPQASLTRTSRLMEYRNYHWGTAPYFPPPTFTIVASALRLAIISEAPQPDSQLPPRGPRKWRDGRLPPLPNRLRAGRLQVPNRRIAVAASARPLVRNVTDCPRRPRGNEPSRYPHTGNASCPEAFSQFASRCAPGSGGVEPTCAKDVDLFKGVRNANVRR